VEGGHGVQEMAAGGVCCLREIAGERGLGLCVATGEAVLKAAVE
jgi:hypothetical protein